MSSIAIKPQNIPETLIWYYIILTYPIYLLGAQFVFAPILATVLVVYLLKKWWNQTESTPSNEKIIISLSAWVWLIAILVIEIALVVVTVNSNLRIFEIIAASVLWYKTWGLLALFPLISHLKIRPKLIYRAICYLCLQSVIITLIGTLYLSLHFPNIIYTSPLQIFGSGPKPYEVAIFNNIIHERLTLFGVWPTIFASLCNIYFYCAMQESDKKWRYIGIFSSILMIILSRSRTATLCLPLVLFTVWFLTNVIRPWVQLTTGFVSFLIGIFAPTLINWFQAFKDSFDRARSGSSEIRATIYRLSLNSWWNEAPILGHGVRQKYGPFIAAKIPLGSHHTWIGILFTHGLVGCFALAVAFLWSFIDLLIKAQTSETAKVGLSILLIIFISSFADNVEFFAYLYYPGLIILGSAFQEGSPEYKTQLVSSANS
ncbi:MAG: O-antigen ligase family protein [Desmonostoc vinosum HA7617-LM4]|jgi:hypothetical protein|nr:O-antigen ligase family protein [Desmonostoc vinosum HA7617-LM4]